MDKQTLLTAMTAMRTFYSIQCAYRDHYYKRGEQSLSDSALSLATETARAYHDIGDELNLTRDQKPPLMIREIYNNATVHLEI